MLKPANITFFFFVLSLISYSDMSVPQLCELPFWATIEIHPIFLLGI